MRLYEGDPYGGLERLQRAAQNFYDDVLEVRAIWDTQGVVYDEMRHGIVRAVENCIVKSADADAITRYERFLNIWYDSAPDLEFRRAMVAAAFLAARHVGRPEILQILNLFTDRGGAVGFDSGRVEVTVDGYLSDEAAFVDMLSRKLPAHLGLGVTVVIRREMRWSPPLSMGLAAGGLLSGEPVQHRRRGAAKMGMAPLAHAESRLAGAPPDTRRAVRRALPAAAGGMLGSMQSHEPSATRRGASLGLGAEAGMDVQSRSAADIADGAPRTARTQRPAAMGGMMGGTRGPEDIAPPEPRSTRKQAPPKGGVFLRTHITARPIRREDDNG